MSSSKNSFLLKILLLLLIACIMLAVGVTYGRYLSSIVTASFNISSTSVNVLSVYGGNISEDNLSGSWPDVSSMWIQNDDNAQLEFFVANGSSIEAFAKRDQTYSVRFISGMSADPLAVTLTYVDVNGDEKILYANPEKIVKGSSLHTAYGDGWVYSFLDMNTDEIKFYLYGGEFSYRNFKLNVSGKAEPGLFNVYVTGDLVPEK